jgi:ATPase family AAA domain-containing protein 3A/B
MSNEEGASKESKGMYGFDPTGLERAAKAAKFLDQSPNSKQAFELALKEEEVKKFKEQRRLK